MKCLETRKRNGMTYRRYLLEDGTAKSTYELDASIVRRIGYQKVVDAAKAFQRGEAARALAQTRREYVEKNIGVSTSTIASHLVITEARVRQIKKEIEFAKENTK